MELVYNCECGRLANECIVELHETRMWADAQEMAALPNTGGALFSTPQSLADAHYSSAVQ